MSDEPTKEKFHVVDNAEANAVIAACEHAILHNEAICRVLRNMYRRLQVAEAELAELKGKKPKRSVPP